MSELVLYLGVGRVQCNIVINFSCLVCPLSFLSFSALLYGLAASSNDLASDSLKFWWIVVYKYPLA